MTVQWLGHSCFLITAENGARILMDPCDPSTGYMIAPRECDAVTSSHSHHDHNYFELALGSPMRIEGPGQYEVKGVKIRGVATWHDESRGQKRGPNTVFIIEADGIRLAHMGDIGAMPDEDALSAIAPVDVVLMPIGGVYTVNAQQARDIANALKPKVVIPMHYKTAALSFELDDIAEFLDSVKNCAVHRLRQSEAHLSADSLGSDRVITLEYER